MKDVTLEFLEKLSRADENAKISVFAKAITPTRKGSYIKIQMGLSSGTYFVGEDLENGTVVVEDVS